MLILAHFIDFSVFFTGGSSFLKDLCYNEPLFYC